LRNPRTHVANDAIVDNAIVDRHFALLRSPDRLRGAAVPQRRSKTASVSLDWAQRRGWQLECLSKNTGIQKKPLNRPAYNG